MWSALLLAPLNHLLRQQTWAARRLAGFAGDQGRISLGSQAEGSVNRLGVAFRIADDGSLAEATGDAYDVEVIVAGDALSALADGPQALLASAHVRGRADLAAALQEVFRHLRPDLEDDLARVVGDVAARRISHFLLAGTERLRADSATLLHGACENLQHEAALLPSRADFERFREDALRLQQATDGLQLRIERLLAPQRNG